ncbi:MAG: azurin [Opitutaceae bacterium]
MKLPLLLAALVTALLASGCGQKESSTAPGASPMAAKPAAAAGARTVEITAADNMKFSVASIDAKPGEELKIVLTNIGTLPKEAMGHNWVLLKKGADANSFATAAMTAKDTDYIPAALKDQVIAYTQLLGPRKSDEVTFKAPTEPGEYVFLCSFLGHYLAGMKGVLVVK